MKFSIVHELAVPADKLWENLFEPELEASVKQAIKLSEFRVLESKDAGNLTLRKVHVHPDIPLPGPLKAVFKSLGYTEEDRIAKTGMQYDFSVTPDSMADKIHIGGNFKVEPLGADRCRRTLSGEVTIKIFGVGKLAEKFAIDELDKNYAQVAREQERWIKAKGRA